MRLRQSGLVRRLWVVAALAAVVAALAITAVVTMADDRDQALGGVERITHVLESSRLLERHMVDLEAGLRGFAPTGDSIFLAPWQTARSELPAEFGQLATLVGRDRTGAAQVARLKTSLAAYMTGYGMPLIRHWRPMSRSGLDRFMQVGRQLFDGLRVQYGAFETRQAALERRAESRAEAAERAFETAVIASAAGLLLALVWILLYVGRSIVRPLRRAIAACGAIARGEHRVEMVPDGGPELRELADAFNTMARRLDEREAALVASEERFRRALEHAPVGMAIVGLDGRWLQVNRAFVEITGYSEAELLACDFQAITHPDDVERNVEQRRRLLADEIGSFEAVKRYLHKDGHVVWVELSVALLRDRAGHPAHFVAQMKDITAERAVERERDEALVRFQAAFEQAPIGMVIVGLDGRFQRVNDALCEMTGFSAPELLAMAPFAVVHPEDVEAVRTRFGELRPGSDTLSVEHRIVHGAGHTAWVQARATLIYDEAGRPLHALAQVQDISERRSYEARLRHMADHDPLTGLLNRRGFEAALESHLARCRRYGATGALLAVDLDGFKLVNDTLGHAAGDELIINCAHVLRRRLRETDTVARLGGDEFAILLPGETQAEAELVAETLLEAIAADADVLAHAHPGRVTASIGVAMFSDTTLSADEMLVDADLAMYDAKEAGRDRYSLYSHDGAAVPNIKTQMTWLQRIEAALEEERFVLHAQPIVDLHTGRTALHEVLVRMLDEHGDLIPPNTFLDIAERFGIVRDLDRWVVTQAIRTMARERARGRGLPLAVNISALSTADSELLEVISRELHRGGVTPADLMIEITETAAVADIPRARAFAEGLKDIGCRFALDDFGAGFGSFYYLKHLPFDVVKIDGEFVRHATGQAADRLIIEAVSEIAHGLGKRTVAEFVPDEPTVRLLLRHGVDLAQGYFLGKPLPLEEVLSDQAGRLLSRATSAEAGGVAKL